MRNKYNQPVLKRKLSYYGEEDVEDANRHMQRMRIDPYEYAKGQ
jgi:hypothetical protein